MKPLTAWERLLRTDGLRDPRLGAPTVRIHDANGHVSPPFMTFDDAIEGIRAFARKVPLVRSRTFALRDGNHEWIVSECQGRISIFAKKEIVSGRMTVWDRLLADDILTVASNG